MPSPTETAPALAHTVDAWGARSPEEWPSHWWITHECENRRKCEHSFTPPKWWLDLAEVPDGNGAVAADVDAALSDAVRRIRTFRGDPLFSNETRLSLQGLAIDSLIAAAQPVSASWVTFTLSVLSGMARWNLSQGQSIDRNEMLSQHERTRFIHLGCRGLAEGSRKNYRARLDLIVTAFARAAFHAEVPSTPLRHKDDRENYEPYTGEEVASMWLWTSCFPHKARHRVQAVLALGLGCGLRPAEIAAVKVSEVFTNEDGTHVLTDRGGSRERVVTCHAAWEQRLAALTERKNPVLPLTAPWEDGTEDAGSLQNHLAELQRRQPAAAWLTMSALRTTWMVDHLTHGTPLKVLLRQAALESAEALDRYLQFVPDLTASAEAAAARGVGGYSAPLEFEATDFDAPADAVAQPDDEPAPAETAVPDHGRPRLRVVKN